NLRITEPNPIEYKKNTKFPYEFKWIVSANDLGSKKMKISSTNSDFLKNFFKDENGVPNDIIDDFFNQIDRNGYMTFDYEVVNPVGLSAGVEAVIDLLGITGLILLSYICGLFKKVIDFFKPKKK
ncbi:MAG: hypothetical protein WAR77_03640, partial [Saprospiraceae bacterium]